MTIVRATAKQSVMPFLKRTESTRMQQRTEMECQPFFVNFDTLPASQLEHLRQTGLVGPETDNQVQLLVQRHVEYLSKVFKPSLRPQLRPSFISLDASRSWMIYWSLHGCDLVDYIPTEKECDAIVETLESFYSGGFGGGPGQLAHAATNYGAVMALAIVAGHQSKSEANGTSRSALTLLRRIRKPLYEWIMSLADSEGRVRMHHDGEIDVRATYCTVAVLSLLRLPLPEKWASFVAQCQTWEGGFGGEPGGEAHGGYTYCATAALRLLDSMDLVDVDAIADYVSRRQMTLEGGFSGRSNKLVDGCYSFWQGGTLAIAGEVLASEKTLLFDGPMLERYILLCAQDVHGGLRDKPSKNRDFYHSCYNLSGLSIAKHRSLGEEFSRPARVGETHPCYNIRVDHADYIRAQFESLKDVVA